MSKYRLSYDPEFHENHNKPWKIKDVIYLCSMWDYMKKADIALALGRTHGSVLTQADQLRKQGVFNKFKNM